MVYRTSLLGLARAVVSVALLSASGVVGAQTVAITTPANNSTGTVNTAITLTATATGTLNRVRYKQNGTIVSTGPTTAPYTDYYTPTSPGTYVFVAEAIRLGAVVATSAPVTVTVAGTANVAPNVTLTAPANGTSQLAGSTFNLTATASDSDGSVASVKFYADGQLLSTDTTSPYTGTYSTTATGGHTLTAVATDNLGAAKTSTAVSVTVTNGSGSGPASVTRTYVYDANERLCKTIDPEAGATLVDYDAAGNIAWVAAGTSLTTNSCDRAAVTDAMKETRSYDAMNRQLTTVTADGIANVTTTYTPDGLVATMSANNPSGYLVNTTYAYNKRRLLESETASQPGWYAWTIQYGYDINGHQNSLTYPSGLQVTYAPDALGRPSQVGSFASGIVYYPNGAIKQFTYGNGITHVMTQNARGLPTRSQDLNVSTPVLDDTYHFDANGNVADIIDQAQGTSRGMAYDGIDRLTTAVSTGTAQVPMWGTAQYTYDALDNIRSSSLGSSGYAYNYDANNRLASLDRIGGGTYTYTTDARGNVTGDGRQNYEWDSRNRLLGVTGKEYYRYDGLGRRALSWRPGANSSTSLFMYSKSGQVAYVEDAIHQQSTCNIYLGNTLVAARNQSYAAGAPISVRYQHTDALGSPVATTDESRNVVERTIYAPYGASVNRPVEGVGYTGHVMDQTTGLTYMQQRYYDPSIGRFMSIDSLSVGQADGGNFGRYWYAGNNPYKFTDPDGRCFWDGCVGEAIAVAAIAGAAVGMVVEGAKQYQAGKFDGRSLAVAGAVGAASGAALAVVGGTAVAGAVAGAITAETAAGSIVVGGAVVGGASDSATRALTGQPQSLSGSATAAAAGAFVAPLSAVAEPAVGATVATRAIPRTGSFAIHSTRNRSLSGGVFNTAYTSAKAGTERPLTSAVITGAASTAGEAAVKKPFSDGR